MNKKFFSLEKNKQIATLNIYGDITSYPWAESDVSSASLSKQLDALGDVEQIDVYINSYGGEVAEGLAIYNALKRHKASVVTICDGFACSIASVIFMAGDERIMNESSLLMIHNAWTLAEGNAEQLRKQADDLEKITQASVEAYKANSDLSEEEIKALMDAETWILPEEAIEYGFATAIGLEERTAVSQSVKAKLFEIVKAAQEQPEDDDEGAEAPDSGEEAEPEEEPTEEPENPADEPTEDENGEDDEPAEEEPEEEPDADDETEEPAQRMCGFFNALLKTM